MKNRIRDEYKNNSRIIVFILFIVLSLATVGVNGGDHDNIDGHHNHDGLDGNHEHESIDNDSKYEKYKDQEHKEHKEHKDRGGHGQNEEHSDHENKGKIIISESVLKISKISLSKVNSRRIKSIRKFNGRVSPNMDKVSIIVPRYPGVVKKVYKNLGDKIKKGDILVQIEANSGLSKYLVKSKINGMLVEKNVTSGEYVGAEAKMFKIADLKTVWVDINLTGIRYKKVKLGQKIFLKLWGPNEAIDGKIEYISPIVNYDSQAFLARTTINNSSNKWRPGSFVYAELVLVDDIVALSIDEKAIQILEDKKVIFVKGIDGFEARNVELGRSGDGFVEVKSGVLKGDQYVSSNSFVLKSELLKATAGHDHAH